MLIALDAHFVRHGDQVFAPPTIPPEFFLRYPDPHVLARVTRTPVAGMAPVQGPVVFHDLPDYRGPRQLAAVLPRARSVIRNAIVDQSVILRLPGSVASLVWWEVRHRRYGVELCGDPFDAFSAGGVEHPLRAVFRQVLPLLLRYQVKRAAAVAYVTREALQRRYPAAGYTTHYSSIELADDALVAVPRVYTKPGKRLIFVGSLQQNYKGLDVLLRAIAWPGSVLTLVVIGDGAYRSEYEIQARQLGIEGRVCFRGHVPAGAAIRDALDAADLFVLPSRTEGLPRAMIEAMARALPCVGTAVGGIPELLPASALVPPDDVPALVRAICEMNTPEVLTRHSCQNLTTAQGYRAEVLQLRRAEFCRVIG